MFLDRQYILAIEYVSYHTTAKVNLKKKKNAAKFIVQTIKVVNVYSFTLLYSISREIRDKIWALIYFIPL